LIGKYARKNGLKTDLIVTSPATRAKSTAELFIAAAGLENALVSDERIYEASARRLLQVMSGLDDEHETVLLVGHNPGFADLFEQLTGEARKVPTASLTCIKLDIDKWSAPKGGKGKLKWRMTPKKLKKQGMDGRTQSLRETP
jgi:phosphohistidine phosphatase